MKLFSKIKSWHSCTLSPSLPSPSLLSQSLLRTHLLFCAAVVLSFTCLTLLGVTMITEMSRAALAERIADQVLRFHVIANSDSEEDQGILPADVHEHDQGKHQHHAPNYKIRLALAQPPFVLHRAFDLFFRDHSATSFFCSIPNSSFPVKNS